MGLTPVVMGQPVKANRPLRNARRHTTEHNKNYAILKFPQTYPGLGTPTDSGTFAGNLKWFIKSWVWYWLNLIRTYLLHPMQTQNKNYEILGFPQTYPSLGTPTDSGTFAGILAIPWEDFQSWFSYDLFLMNWCGVVDGVADVFDIVKTQWSQKDMQR